MYQPPYPVQTKIVLDRIIDKSYLKLTNDLLNSNVNLSVNINASLTEMLDEHDKEGPLVIDNLSKLAENKQIEFLESGAYHPLFPLLPKEYVKIQIKMNNEINRKIFGSIYHPIGIFPPELALNSNITNIISDLGYDFCIASEPTFKDLNFEKIPYISSGNSKLFIIRRNKGLSNDLAFRKFSEPNDFKNEILKFAEGNRSIPVLGMDWETFGEHHQNYIPFLITSLNELDSVSLSEYLDYMKHEENIVEINNTELRSSTWSTDENDILNNIPFPLWDHPKNTLHQMILTLMNILEEAVSWLDKDSIPINFYKSQQSCQLWWCARAGAPDLIKRASNFQIKALKEIKELSESFSSDRKKGIDLLINLSENLVRRINITLKIE